MSPPPATAAAEQGVTTVLGIDAGGTKTRAVFATRGPGGRCCVLGEGLAGPGNPLGCGVDQAAAAIHAAARQALGANAAPPDFAVAAVAGAADPTARQQLTAALEELPLLAGCKVTPDYAPLFCLAPQGQNAIALIAGTGATAMARDATGAVWRSGGWGYLLGDDGSGYALGRAAIRHALAERDSRRDPGPLAQSVARELGAHTLADVPLAVYRAEDPRRAIARLAKLVCQAADAESDAQQLVELQAKSLADHARRAAAAARLANACPVVIFAGSLALRSQLFRDSVVASLRTGGMAIERVELAHDPASLALQLAHDEA